jgi:hypothetical protein
MRNRGVNSSITRTLAHDVQTHHWRERPTGAQLQYKGDTVDVQVDNFPTRDNAGSLLERGELRPQGTYTCWT